MLNNIIISEYLARILHNLQILQCDLHFT